MIRHKESKNGQIKIWYSDPLTPIKVLNYSDLVGNTIEEKCEDCKIKLQALIDEQRDEADIYFEKKYSSGELHYYREIEITDVKYDDGEYIPSIKNYEAQ